MPRHHTQTRRGFVAAVAGGLFTMFGAPRRPVHRCRPSTSRGPHPDPRPGVDGSQVLTAEQLERAEHVIRLYDDIRKIPHIVDGIRCKCGCADLEGFRSLLTCYESSGMAMSCQICQGEGRMVVRLHAAGRTLDQIRAAVDARYGAG